MDPNLMFSPTIVGAGKMLDILKALGPSQETWGPIRDHPLHALGKAYDRMVGIDWIVPAMRGEYGPPLYAHPDYDPESDWWRQTLESAQRSELDRWREQYIQDFGHDPYENRAYPYSLEGETHR